MNSILQKVNEINPVDKGFINQLKGIGQSQYQQQTARQPYIGDWQELNAAEFAYNSIPAGYDNNGIIDITGFTPSSRFSVGDRLRFKQGGAYKYNYIVGVDATSIDIAGDEDTPLTNATITDIAFSKFISPTGFPSQLDFDSDPQGFSSIGLQVDEFWMVGNMVYTRLQIGGTSNSGDLTLTPPTVNALATDYQFCYAQNNNLPVTGGRSSMYIMPGFGCVLDYGATMFTSSNTKGVYAIFMYPVGT